jgi:hypothetical protein
LGILYLDLRAFGLAYNFSWMQETTIMSATLIDAVRSAFTVEIQDKMSTLLGEKEDNIHRAMHGAIPLVLIDILHKSYNPEHTARVWELSRQAAAGDFFGEMHQLTISTGGLVPGSVLLNKGADYAKSLLALRYDSVVAEAARYAGISLPSAGFVTGVVSFATLDAIGRHIATYNVDSATLATWLRTQIDSVRPATPTGLQIRTALGVHHYPWEPATRRSRNTAGYIVLMLIIIAVGIFFLYQYRKTHMTVFTPTDTSLSPHDSLPLK